MVIRYINLAKKADDDKHRNFKSLNGNNKYYI